MIPADLEKKIWARARKHLQHGRPNDLEHTRRVVAHGKALLVNETGDLWVVIPALILHDTGWSRVDFSDFIDAPPESKKDAISTKLHMRHGADIAREILEDLNYKPGLIQRIAAIIAVHDAPDKIQALRDPNATLVFEADWLDKYGQASQKRYSLIFNDKEKIEELNWFLETNKLSWFRTKSARELLQKIVSDNKQHR